MERGQPDTLIREEKTQTGQENGWKGNFKTLPPNTHTPVSDHVAAKKKTTGPDSSSQRSQLTNSTDM